jgi:6-phosphogluconolactonase
MNNPQFTNCRFYDDVAQLGYAAAEQFIALADEAIRSNNCFNVALSGGSTPKILFQELVNHLATAIDWRLVHFFWSDERFVAPEQPDSNAGMAIAHLLQPLHIPQQNIHLVPTYLAEPAQAAAAYEATIRRKLPESAIPGFDLILLGLGDDGHTASLFPKTTALDARQELVAANWVTKFNKWRITFTFPLLNSAKNIIFLVAGESKASVIYDIFINNKDCPAARINPVNGQILWLLDKAAGRLILQ